MSGRAKQRYHSFFILIVVLFTAICMLPFTAFAEDIPEQNERGWVDFILVCNEGNSNTGGNVGNTMMVVSMKQR